jgi:hypothetical protein
MKRPGLDDIEVAAMWLEVNEGDDGEAESCSRVATWLRTYARESEERAAARQVGCSVKYLRKYMASRTAPSAGTGDRNG